MKISLIKSHTNAISFLTLSLLLPLCLSKEEIHSRQKRILWVTADGRLALPPGTTLVITPSLSLPFVRYPPDGFFSNMTVSLPFTSKFYISTFFVYWATDVSKFFTIIRKDDGGRKDQNSFSLINTTAKSLLSYFVVLFSWFQ